MEKKIVELSFSEIKAVAGGVSHAQSVSVSALVMPSPNAQMQQPTRVPPSLPARR